MIDAVLLDWEDVILETRALRRAALTEAFRNRGLPFDNDAYETLCADRSVHSAASNMLAHSNRRDAALADLVAFEAHSLFRTQLSRPLTLVPHAQEFVEGLHAKCRLAIVTSASRSETTDALSRTALTDLFTVVVCGEDGDLHDPVSTALDRLSRVRAISAGRCIGVFAHHNALQAARAAKLRTVAVNAQAHIAVSADAAIHSFEGLTAHGLARLAGIPVKERT